MKKIISLCMVMAVLFSISASAMAMVPSDIYFDVPENSWALESLEKAQEYNLMEGIANGEFGYGKSISRAEFVTVLVRMFGWDLESGSSFDDTANHWASSYIETAAEHNVVSAGGKFHPDTAITREDMAVMLIRALGYAGIAESAENYSMPFNDVDENRGYIALAYDIGMTDGVSETKFAPDKTAKREEAAAMFIRIYEKYYAKTSWAHGFYAISAYNQIDLTKYMDAVSVGWSRLSYSQDGGAVLNTSSSNGNEYAIPSGYADAVKKIMQNGAAVNLSVYMDDGGDLLSEMLANQSAREAAADAIVSEATRSYDGFNKSFYSGVTIDFEGLFDSDKDNFTAFLTYLSGKLKSKNMTLYVTVMPATSGGDYYDGYDYRAIGQLADKIILMAHDYQPRSLDDYIGTEYYKNAAMTPIDSVYYSLRAITDADTGVEDPSKVVLAINCTANAWQTDEDGNLTSGSAFTPSQDTVYSRMTGGAALGFSDIYRDAWMTYVTQDGQHVFMWYENGRSVGEKLTLAKLFGIDSVSFWRIGLIPNYSDTQYDYNFISAAGLK